MDFPQNVQQGAGGSYAPRQEGNTTAQGFSAFLIVLTALTIAILTVRSDRLKILFIHLHFLSLSLCF
jgi:hypothetical protein